MLRFLKTASKVTVGLLSRGHRRLRRRIRCAHGPGYKPVAVYSGSMEPTIHVGGLALDRAIPSKNVRVGDVITFSDPYVKGRLVTHRVIHVLETPHGLAYRTKGDANPGAIRGRFASTDRSDASRSASRSPATSCTTLTPARCAASSSARQLSRSSSPSSGGSGAKKLRLRWAHSGMRRLSSSPVSPSPLRGSSRSSARRRSPARCSSVEHRHGGRAAQLLLGLARHGRTAGHVDRCRRWKRGRALDRPRHCALGSNVHPRLPDHERQQRDANRDAEPFVGPAGCVGRLRLRRRRHSLAGRRRLDDLNVTTSTTVAGRGTGTLRLGLSGTSWLYRDYSFQVDEAPEAPAHRPGRRSPRAASTSSWSASTTTTNLAGYDVYRSSGGAYTKLTATPLTALTYSDTATVDGTAYTYKFTAVSSGSPVLDEPRQHNRRPRLRTQRRPGTPTIDRARERRRHRRRLRQCRQRGQPLDLGHASRPAR